jgi:hypothetical protein
MQDDKHILERKNGVPLLVSPLIVPRWEVREPEISNGLLLDTRTECSSVSTLSNQELACL